MLESLQRPSKALALHGQNVTEPTRELSALFEKMRRQIAQVYPDASPAWTWKSEYEHETRTIQPPTRSPEQWLATVYKGSDPFSQGLVRRYFTLWRDLEKRGFKTNDKKMYAHQKALSAWLTIAGVCTGIREEFPSVLMRSPYGTGKSLVGGFAVEGFQDYLLEMMFDKVVQATDLPNGAILGHRMGVIQQNALGKQYTVLRPPYTVEESHIKQYHKELTAMYGGAFARAFPPPNGRKDPWLALFQVAEDEDEDIDVEERLTTYMDTRRNGNKVWERIRNSDMVHVLRRLMAGEILLQPDVYNRPRVREAPPRSIERGQDRFHGDIAHALNPLIGIKASHRHLMHDPAAYDTTINHQHPAHFCIATGTALTRRPESMRTDIYELIKNLRLLVVDEAGKLSPEAVGDSTYLISDRMPMIVGLTGKDEGIEGWIRSPTMSVQRSIELRLTKPVAFQLIGSNEECYPQGSEGAWEQYEKALFAPVKAATALDLPQPWESDGLIVVPASLVREYAHRIHQAYLKHGIEADIICVDCKAGTDRWKMIEDTLRAPKIGGATAGKRDRLPPRKVVGTAAELGVGTSMPIDCTDVLADLKEHELDQLLGREYHNRNMGGRPENRTYFRQQIFTGTKLVLLRKKAAEMGFPLPDEGATHIPLQCVIDATAKEADDRRKGLGKPEPVPDVKQPGQPKKPEGKGRLHQPMKITSPFLIAEQKKKVLQQEERAKLEKKNAKSGVRKTPEGTVYTVKRKNEGVACECEVLIGPSNMPDAATLDALAKTFEITAYSHNFIEKVQRVLFGMQHLRDKKLAEATLDAIIFYQRVKKRGEKMRNGSQAPN